MDTHEVIVPRTERERLMMERAELYKALANATKAYSELSTGRVTSYSLGNRSVSRNAPDLKSLLDFIRWAKNRIYEIEATLRGEPIRNVTRHTFVDPTCGLWRCRG